jgi:hypothetical protein
MTTHSYKRRIVLFGPPKCGKTENLANLPKGSTLYYLDIDRQRGTLERAWKEIHGNFKGLESVELPDAGDKDQAAFQVYRRAFWNPPKGFGYYAADSYTKLVLNLTHSICGKGDRHYNMFNNQKLSSAANDFWFQWVNRIETIEPEAWIVTVMHERWEEIDDGTMPEDSRDKPKRLIPKCGTSAEVQIPGSCDFVWHVEKGRKIEKGRNVKLTYYRTEGTATIMASSGGADLDTLEEADLGAIVEHLGMVPKSKPKPVKKPLRKVSL